MAEKAKISMRNIRREANDNFKKDEDFTVIKDKNKELITVFKKINNHATNKIEINPMD